MTYTKLVTEIEVRARHHDELASQLGVGRMCPVDFYEQAVVPWRESADTARVLALFELLNLWRDCALFGPHPTAVQKTIEMELKILHELEST